MIAVSETSYYATTNHYNAREGQYKVWQVAPNGFLLGNIPDDHDKKRRDQMSPTTQPIFESDKYWEMF